MKDITITTLVSPHAPTTDEFYPLLSNSDLENLFTELEFNDDPDYASNLMCHYTFQVHYCACPQDMWNEADQEIPF